MANSATLAQLKTRIRERADMENSQFIADSELLSYINMSYAEIYDLMVTTYEDYYVTTQDITLTSGDSGVSALPADFSKLRGVDYQLGGNWVTIYPYDWNTRNLRQRAVNKIAIGDLNLTYRVVGSNLRIEPRDGATGTYQMWYIPVFTPLSGETDLVDSHIARHGWEEYIVVDAAIKCLAKEESNTEHLLLEKRQLIKRIEGAAGDRDADQPEQIADVSRYKNNDWGPGRW